MTTLDRMTDEFRRLDDELSAAVSLPSVDSVIRRAGTLNRASTAAAAAVLTVGGLGGITAVAQATVGPAQASTSNAEAVITPAAPTTTTPPAELPPAVVAPPADQAAPAVPQENRSTRTRAQTAPGTTAPKPAPVAPKPPVVVPPAPKPPVVTTIVPAPTTNPGGAEGTQDPTTTPRTPKPTTTHPRTPRPTTSAASSTTNNDPGSATPTT